MRNGLRPVIRLFFSLCFVLVATAAARAQANDADYQDLSLSAFGAGTGTFTGLTTGKNLGLTAGIDLRVYQYHRFLPSIEVRGTEPVFHKGPVDSQKNALVGLKVERIYGHAHPYVDFLIGRGEIDYQSGGFVNPAGTYNYLYTVSNVFSPGFGVDYDLTHYWAAKFDFQLQHYDTPVVTSGSIYAKSISVGAVYRFDFNHHIHYKH